MTDERLVPLTEQDETWLRTRVGRFHGGINDGAAHDHMECRLLAALDLTRLGLNGLREVVNGISSDYGSGEPFDEPARDILRRLWEAPDR